MTEKKAEKKSKNVNIYGHVDPELVTKFEAAAVKDCGTKHGFKGRALAKALELYINCIDSEKNEVKCN